MQKLRFLAMRLASHVLLRSALETVMVPAAREPFLCLGCNLPAATGTLRGFRRAVLTEQTA